MLKGNKMSKKFKIEIRIEDENGEILVASQSERSIPYIEEIDTQGFRSAFHDLETAVLESRKEVVDEALEEYLARMSEKKRTSKPTSAASLTQNLMQ